MANMLPPNWVRLAFLFHQRDLSVTRQKRKSGLRVSILMPAPQKGGQALRAQRTQAALPKSQSMDLIRPDYKEVT